MKKFLALLLCAVLLFSLAACAQLDALKDMELPPLPTPAAATPEPEAEPTPEPTATPEPTPELPQGAELGERVSVYFNKTREVMPAPDNSNRTILDFSYVTPTVKIEGNAEASAAINEQLRLFDEAYYTGTGNGDGINAIYEMATDNYTYAVQTQSDINTQFSSARTVSAARADGSVLSFFYYTSLYQGGSTGSEQYTGLSFDAQSGAKLTLSDLGGESEGLAAVLTETLGSDNAVEDVMALDFALTGEGLTLYPANVTVPYESLYGVMDEKFFPVQREGEAELAVIGVNEVEDGTIESLDRVVENEGGEELYLSVKGTAYDVSLSRVEYADHGQRFFETERLWYSSFMTDSAVQVATMIPDGMPNLMISYTDALGETHRRLVSQSGEDGSLLLVDDSIEAVG